MATLTTESSAENETPVSLTTRTEQENGKSDVVNEIPTQSTPANEPEIEEEDEQLIPEKQLTIRDEKANIPTPSPEEGNNKGSRTFNLIRAALSLLRRKDSTKPSKPPTAPAPIPVNSNASALSRLVRCVRPLNVQGCGAADEPSPSPPGMTSRYASAQSLPDLVDEGAATDNGGDSGSEEVFHDGIPGDHMIDSKADDFIAKFYEQVKNDHDKHTTD